MGKKHDAIVHALSKEAIVLIFGERLFGEIGCWSCLHEAIKETDEKKLREYAKKRHETYDMPLDKFKELIIEAQRNVDIISCNKKHRSLKITKRIEVPIIKGYGEYKTTKGFLDLVFDMKPYEENGFACYNQDQDSKRLIIEVKKLKDFDDTGSIIRQLNNYKQYYFEMPMNSEIFDNGSSSFMKNTFWAVVCDEEIPKMSKEMLEGEGYICINLREFDMNPMEISDGK